MAQNYVKVNQWIMKENFGFGYQLSDDTYGQLLPDKSLMFTCFDHIRYKDARSDSMTILYQRDLDLLSPQVYKRFKMLKWF